MSAGEEGEDEDEKDEEDRSSARSPEADLDSGPQVMADEERKPVQGSPLVCPCDNSSAGGKLVPSQPTEPVYKGERSDDEQSIASVDSEVSVGACSSLWEGGSEEGRGSLTATPTSSEEGHENISGTPNSETDVEASSTVGVTEATPYPCSFCELAFPRLSYLKRHEQSHSDRLPFRCSFCGRHFKHKRSRDRHVKLHTGDKKYKCAHCDAAFSRSDHLKIHLKTHDTQKPFRCAVCARGYSTAAALTAHMQNHKARRTPATPTTPLDRLLKDVGGGNASIGGCDPTLISRLIQDSTGNSPPRNKEASKNQAASLDSGGSPNNPPSSDSPSRPPLSPASGVRCPLCQAHCKGHSQLQQHLSRHHSGEDAHGAHGVHDRPPSTSNPSGSSSSAEIASGERPPSESNNSGASSIGGAAAKGGMEVSPTASSSPSSRPTSAMASPRPLNPGITSNPFLALVGGKLACPLCAGDGFPSFEAFHLHLQSVHGSMMGSELLSGGLPPALSSYRGGLFSPLFPPLGGAGSSRQVTCELCGARVGGVSALQRHVVTAHSFTDLLARAAEGVFCAQCLLPFSNPGALAEHIKLVHAAPVAPPVGPLTLLSGALAKRPPSPPTPTRPTDLSKKPRRGEVPPTGELPSSTLLCAQCDAPFADFESFRAHLKTHLDVGGEGAGGHQLSCPECQVRVRSEAALESHLASHLEATWTEYGCPACRKSFAKPDQLQKHLLDMHAHHLYRCAICRQLFDSKVSIQVHFAVRHSDEATVHKCLKCAHKCHSRAEFDAHLRECHLGTRDPPHNGLISPAGEGTPAHASPPAPKGTASGGGGGFRCLLCPVSMATEAEVSAHLAHAHERRFRCALCEEAFHVEFLLDRHVQVAHAHELNGAAHPEVSSAGSALSGSEGIDLRCGVCDTLCASEAALALHRKAAHAHKGSGSAHKSGAALSLFCAYCSEVCKSRADLDSHVKVAHMGATGGRHKCNICDEVFPSAPTLAAHKLAHVKVLSGGSAPCAVCREQLGSAEQVRTHQREHHPRPLPQPCIVCRQTLVTDVELTAHARFHAPAPTEGSDTDSGGAYKCPEYHVKFESEEVQSHECSPENVHEAGGGARGEAEGGQTYQCIKCQESFVSEGAVEAHVAAHLEREGGASHVCHLCRAQLDTPLRLQRHLIEHTFEGCGAFTCYLCGAVFTTAARLVSHMGGHGLGQRPYDCPHCRQRFFFRAELDNHLAGTHPQGAVSKDPKPTLATHILPETPPTTNKSPKSDAPATASRSHSNATGESPSGEEESSPTSRPQMCKTCGRRCRDHGGLHRHCLTHEGAKPYLCGECGAAFTRRCEAARHHHGDAPPVCVLCRRESSSRSDALAHVGTAHGGGPDAEVVRPNSRCSSCDGDMDSSDSSQTPP